jgi:hypothetical protein
MSNDTFKTFNRVYFEFLSFIKTHSPEDKLFQSFYKKNYILKSTNIKMFIKGWYEHISCKYYDLIMAENTDDFLKHDFTQVIDHNILKYIHLFQIKGVETHVLEMFMTYVKDLTRISYMYFK